MSPTDRLFELLKQTTQQTTQQPDLIPCNECIHWVEHKPNPEIGHCGNHAVSEKITRWCHTCPAAERGKP